MKRIIFAVLFTLLMMSTQSVQAQLKVGAGYDFSYSGFETLNEVIENYNANTEALIAMGDFHISHGVVFNLRYEIGFVGIEGGWVFRFSDKEATIDDANSLQLRNRHQTFSFGIDNRFEWISYGGSLDYDVQKINARVNGLNRNVEYMNSNNFYATLYLGFGTFNNPTTNISFRPFVRIPLTNFDYNDLDTNVNGAPTLSNSKGAPWVFGFRLIFMNG